MHTNRLEINQRLLRTLALIAVALPATWIFWKTVQQFPNIRNDKARHERLPLFINPIHHSLPPERIPGKNPEIFPKLLLIERLDSAFRAWVDFFIFDFSFTWAHNFYASIPILVSQW